jgi:hypothetical protein
MLSMGTIPVGTAWKFPIHQVVGCIGPEVFSMVILTVLSEAEFKTPGLCQTAEEFNGNVMRFQLVATNEVISHFLKLPAPSINSKYTLPTLFSEANLFQKLT